MGKTKSGTKAKGSRFSHSIEVKQIEGDILNYYYIARK
jgi:hypothetical protein